MFILILNLKFECLIDNINFTIPGIEYYPNKFVLHELLEITYLGL